ncbi:hypothetical protein [Chondromyces crocatus]|uniref:Uncharacterized protein n=1 Tax=Chondromyces crocatus TaxID=52 RepID=A0A0K1EBH8_CHOCO|nr:hypothetical protein [Chondromyces crocatus]AKT37933.1 uncharacterized protein CMC5_020760 [Chondromyces crocatus]
MFTTSTLDNPRKLVVGNAVSNALNVNRPNPLLSSTQLRAEALVDASERLRFFIGISPQRVDQATDTVVTSFRAHLEKGEQVLKDSVVPLGAPQREALGRFRMLRTRLFPKGTAYIRASMDLQWGELVALRGALHEPEVVDAIAVQGMQDLSAHLLEHIALYGRMLGKEAGSARAGVEEASGVWNEAMRLFTAQVVLDYEKDAAIQQELLGTYHAQLEQQRASYRTRKVPSPADKPSSGNDAENRCPEVTGQGAAAAQGTAVAQKTAEAPKTAVAQQNGSDASKAAVLQREPHARAASEPGAQVTVAQACAKERPQEAEVTGPSTALSAT